MERDPVAIDCDGSLSVTRFPPLNPSIPLPRWLYTLLFPLLVYLIFADSNGKCKEVVKALKASGKEIIVVSARPESMKKITEAWLEWKGIPYDRVYCIGPGKGAKRRKLEVLKREGVRLYIDDEHKNKGFFTTNGIIVLTPKEFVKMARGGT